MEGSSRGDMKSLKINREDALVRSKWSILIGGICGVTVNVRVSASFSDTL